MQGCNPSVSEGLVPWLPLSFTEGGVNIYGINPEAINPKINGMLGLHNMHF